MVTCVAYGCTNRSSKKIPGITFHRFPLNLEQRQLWIKAIKRSNWTPSKWSCLCSLHFSEDQIDRTSLSSIRLRENAVPNIFEAFPSYLQKKKKLRKLPKERIFLQSIDAPSNSNAENILPEEDSPRKKHLKRKLEDANEAIISYRKKIKILQQKNRRYKKKFESFASIIKEIKKKECMTEDDLEILIKASGPNKELLIRQLAKKADENQPKFFSPEVRSFALTLHFFSPRAYDYVRSTFNSCLPHPRTLARWYNQIEANPGFTAEAIIAIQNTIMHTPYPLLFSLIMDEMAIRQHVEFDGKKFHGYIDMGVNIPDDSLPLAKEALVLMLVCINASWKIPIGYFIIQTLTAEQKCNIVNQCLCLLHQANVRVVSLTFDGLSSNLTMAKLLGCSFEPTQLNTAFEHPISKEKIYIIPDACHMLKLVRNTLGDKKSMFKGEDMIDWKYIQALHNLQEGEGLNFANRLKASHVHFHKQKMKVKLASQLLSKSVADAILFCEKELNLPDFTNSKATVEFIKKFNDLFDILNSRSMKHHGLKQPINQTNEKIVFDKLSEIDNYISDLKESRNGGKIINSSRKTGFIGFKICIESVKNLYKILVKDENLLKYLPTHKLSQDHIELFFQTIRFQGGCNNNPTARQFKGAYKKLLIKSELKASGNGNCVPLDELKILSISSAHKPEHIINLSSNGHRALDDNFNIYESQEHDYIFNASNLTQSSEHIIYYIAGYIVKRLSDNLSCELCINSLSTKKPFLTQSLISYKSNGGLIHPSKDVFLICKKCESLFRLNISNENGKCIKKEHTLLNTELKILRSLMSLSLFSELNNEMHDISIENNHIAHLIRAIVKKYLTIRYMYWGKNIINNATSLRHLYTKTILFKGL